MRHLFILCVALCCVALAAPAAARAAEPPRGDSTFRSFRAPNGVALRYHVLAAGIDRSRPVGAVVFFDGDGTSRFGTPRSWFVRRMAKAARRHQMALVFVEAPNRGRVWWAGLDRHGDAVRALAARRVVPWVDGRLLLVGYSGGAQFITKELLAEDRPARWLPSRTAALMVGGGGVDAPPVRATAESRRYALDWVVGARDGYGATDPPDWSALLDSRRGFRAYRSRGYPVTTRRVLPATNHDQYDIPAIVDRALRR